MVKKKLKLLLSLFTLNPVFSAALVCAVMFYGNFIKLKDKNSFASLIPLTYVYKIEGKLVSNPVKSSSGKNTYSADILVNKVKSKNGAESSARGNVKLLLPAEMAEKYYPGKIYTALKQKESEPLIFETGNHFVLTGKMIDSGELLFFKVESATARGFSNDFFGKIQKFRALCRIQFKRLMYGWGNAGGLLLALLSGSREYTEQVTVEGFKNAGLSHILALSGMHLSLFGGIAFLFGSAVTRRSIADFLQLSAVIFFVWFAGLSPSLFRAMVSSFIVFFNSFLRMKRFKGLTVLSATFLIHLVIFPEHLKSPAFMLSYGALAGIMSIGQVIKFFLGKRLFPKISSALSDSAGAQVFTAPVTLSLFGKLMPIGILSSVILNPVVIFFLYMGLVATMLCLFMPFLSSGFNVIMNFIYSILKETVLFFSGFPQISIQTN